MKKLGLGGVSVRFGRVQALSSVSLELEAGQVVMLAGPNGAGKSTLIRVLLGLVRPNSGELRVDGQVRTVDNDFKQSLGYLPENVAFTESLSGWQTLRFFARARGVSKQRVQAVFERIGLQHAARRAVRGYSRGMRQRLALGVAILAEPELLILDEPTGGLDQEGLGVLWQVLEEWREKGRMVLVATHELALMDRRVDRMCLLQSGKVRAMNSPTHLRMQAALPVRVSFALDGNGIPPEPFVQRIEAWGRGLESKLDAESLRVAVAPADLLGLLDLRGQGVDPVVSVRVEEPGLDDVYEHLLSQEEQ